MKFVCCLFLLNKRAVNVRSSSSHKVEATAVNTTPSHRTQTQSSSVLVVTTNARTTRLAGVVGWCVALYNVYNGANAATCAQLLTAGIQACTQSRCMVFDTPRPIRRHFSRHQLYQMGGAICKRRELSNRVRFIRLHNKVSQCAITQTSHDGRNHRNIYKCYYNPIGGVVGHNVTYRTTSTTSHGPRCILYVGSAACVTPVRTVMARCTEP